MSKLSYGPVLTYKDIEEAKSLIGKKCLFSDDLYAITEYPAKLAEDLPEDVGEFTDIATDFEIFSPFKMDNIVGYQFIREIIEEEPQYRPFNSVGELVEYWEKHYGNKNRPNGTMPLIWIKSKSTGNKLLITAFIGTEVANGEDIYSMEDLLDKFTFLDGSPLGVVATCDNCKHRDKEMPFCNAGYNYTKDGCCKGYEVKE